MKKRFSLCLVLSVLLSTFVFNTNALANYERSEKMLAILVEFTETTLPREGCDPLYTGNFHYSAESSYSDLFFVPPHHQIRQ